MSAEWHIPKAWLEPGELNEFTGWRYVPVFTVSKTLLTDATVHVADDDDDEPDTPVIVDGRGL